MTLVCAPITVESIDRALADAAVAAELGAELVEFRIDGFFEGSSGDDATDALAVAELRRLIAASPLPVILTCRPTWEGGDYDGDDADRIALFEKLTAASDTPPAYLDVELAAYQRSANLRQKINLCVAHPKQDRPITTRLILSTHDFTGRPADLERKLLAMYDEPACAIVKVAYRARSLRDNLDLFEIIRSSPKPTIALGMGEFGLMSRVLAPKFGGFLTFASLRDTSATAPGQPTIADLLGMYNFRHIGRETRTYGVIGWPVTQSMSPLIHNAGFQEVGYNGVYLPLPIAADADNPEGSATSFAATVQTLASDPELHFRGASVTIPHKEHAARAFDTSNATARIGAANTLAWTADNGPDAPTQHNTDATAIRALLDESLGGLRARRICIAGAGGVARAAIDACLGAGAHVRITNRTAPRADELVRTFKDAGDIARIDTDKLTTAPFDAYINCTPIGMTDGPDPDGLTIPIPDMTVPPETVFFDTVYNPIDTPMLRVARERGCQTIDGVQMFVRQAAEQFMIWTDKPAPIELFDRLVREKLSSKHA